MLRLTNIGQLVTPRGFDAKKGVQMNDVFVCNDAEILIDDAGNIIYAGPRKQDTTTEISKKSQNATVDEVSGQDDNTPCRVFDCEGNAVIPGFVDSHTHLVFGGNRADEFMWRQSGISYMEIMERGGGIMSTVRSTREQCREQILLDSMQRLDELLQNGVTLAEIKSGYGLDIETELKQLEIIRDIQKTDKIDIVSTFMGAHAVPPEYKGRNMDYIDFIIGEVLPLVRDKKCAEFVDIFCEKGVFSIEESQKLLLAASKMGFSTKIHADEIVSSGGAELAARLGCVSADHLLQASDEGIDALANSKTIATLLPLTAFCLKEPYANARKMIDSGAAVALATDLNPGSCFSSSIPLLIAISVIYMKMSIFEVITALTLNGACALNRQKTNGSIEAGKKADMLVLKYPSVNYLAYHSGVNCIKTVFKNGRIICNNN